MKRLIVIELDESENVERIIKRLGVKEVITYTKPKETWEQKLEELLKCLKIGANYKGYQTMFMIMSMFAANPKYQEYFILKDIYAKDIRLDNHNTERRIRHIITVIKRNSPEQIEKVLGEKDIDDISVKEFIALISRKIFKE